MLLIYISSPGCCKHICLLKDLTNTIKNDSIDDYPEDSEPQSHSAASTVASTSAVTAPLSQSAPKSQTNRVRFLFPLNKMIKFKRAAFQEEDPRTILILISLNDKFQ